MKKPFFFPVLILLLTAIFLVTPICFSQDQNPTPDKAKEDSTDSNVYKIGSGDLLEIITWKEPDFTREVRVRIDGKFAFPLIGDIQASRKTPLEVKKSIEEGLKEFVSDTVVTVIVKEAISQKFYVLGEVNRTGEYPLTKDLTVLQAFAHAGGFTEWASKDEIILLRREAGKSKLIRINFKSIEKGKDLDQDIPIKANDTIIVP